MEKVQQSGWLQREEPGVVGKTFKKRWCVLVGNTMLIYKDEKINNTKEPLVTIHGEDITAVNTSSQKPGARSTGTKLTTLELATRHTTEVLAAENEKDLQMWYDALRPLVSSLADHDLTNKVKYVTVEVFVVKGIRINGQVQPHVLAELGGAGAKKIQDERGWFCDRFAAPHDVLNVMSQHGWELTASFGSDNVSPVDNKAQPIHSFLFRKT